MKKIVQLEVLIVLLFVFLSSTVFATGGFMVDGQRRVVTGVVSAEDGGVLPGVSVVVKGTTRGVVTDVDGGFSINLLPDDDVLVFSFIGYHRQDVLVKDETSISVVLAVDAVEFADVVVVGYGTQKKVNLTGAVSSVDVEKLEGEPVSNVVEALQGTTPGLIIQQSSSQPGSRPSINIRGVNTLNNNDPMVIVDGIIGDIQNVNFSDIENISVLKDAASTAIYGSRASNGVILITTKTGSSGKLKVSYDFNYGLQTPTFLPDVVDSWVYAEMRNEALLNSGQAIRFSPAEIDNFRNNGPNVKWMEEIYKSSAPQQSHNISLSGGNEKTSYLISGAYFDQESLMEGPGYGFERINLRSNIKTKVSEKLNFSVLTSFVRNKITDNAYWTDWIIEQATRMPAIYPIKDENGDYTYVGGSNSNSLARLEQGGKRVSTNDEISSIGNVEYEIIDGLKVRGMTGVRLNYNEQFENRLAIPNSGDSENRMTHINQRVTNITSNLTLGYDKQWGQHNFGALGGFSYEGSKDNSYNTFRILEDSSYDIMAGEQTANTGNQEWMTDWSIYSGFLRLNYNYKEKYLLEFNLRNDRSSKFSKENRSAIFPSLSAAWRISEEDFYTSGIRNIVNSAKLRSSWGVVGNNRIGNYQYQATIGTNQGYNFGDQVVDVANVDVYNPDLTWESTEMLNVALDLGFFDNSVTLTGEYYINNTNDILVALPVPGIYGGGSPLQNAGEVQTKGWELSLSYRVKTGSVEHTLTANISDSKNKVIDLKGTETISGSDVTTIIKEGYAIDSYYAYIWDGIFQNEEEVLAGPHLDGITPKPGDLRYLDKNGDGLVKEDDDRFVVGNRFPRFPFGLNYSMKWKGLDFAMFWQGVGRRDVWMRGESVEAFHNNNEGPVFNFHLDRWTENNLDASYPRLTVGSESANNASKSSFWIQDASYLRLKNLQVGYTLPGKWMKRVGNCRLRVYGSIQNALTFTNMIGGWDPETTSSSGRVYPVNRTYSMGLNFKF